MKMIGRFKDFFHRGELLKPVDYILIFIYLNEKVEEEVRLSKIYDFFSEGKKLSKHYKFTYKPFPYSLKLSNDLYEFVSRGYLQKITIFDDGYTPQYFFRLTMLGRGVAQKKLELFDINEEKGGYWREFKGASKGIPTLV